MQRSHSVWSKAKFCENAVSKDVSGTNNCGGGQVEQQAAGTGADLSSREDQSISDNQAAIRLWPVPGHDTTYNQIIS